MKCGLRPRKQETTHDLTAIFGGKTVKSKIESKEDGACRLVVVYSKKTLMNRDDSTPAWLNAYIEG